MRLLTPFPSASLLTSAACGFIFLVGCSGPSGSTDDGTTPPAPVATLAAPADFLAQVGVTTPQSSATQTATLSNSGTAALTISSIAISGTNAGSFSQTNNCGASLAINNSCTITLTYATPVTASGTFTASLVVSDNASPATQSATLTAMASALAPAGATADCSVTGGTCSPTFTGASITGELPSDPIAAGGFHGYADPSIRKDPNSSIDYIAYSWAKTLSDGTHVVDLHLASSNNNGSTFTEIGPLYTSYQITNTTSSAYAPLNDTSTETVDILPIPLTGTNAGQTLWVQAHQSYLVAPQGGIYDQLNATNLISVTAVLLTNPSGSNAGTSLLALGNATTGEGRLGAVSTDSSRNITQRVSTLSTSTSKCGNWGQPTLWYQSGTLYLALECTEITGTGQVDGNELAHFVYSTTPSGSDASTWTWAYVGEFATKAQAIALGALPSENVAYQFFTEPEFITTKAGQLAIILTPSVFAPQTSQQPVIQYGCRIVPVTLTPTSVTLATDSTTGAPAVLAKITENDLYTGVNEGPAACTYEPTSVNGVIMGRKFEDDPTLGFYIYPLNSGVFP